MTSTTHHKPSPPSIPSGDPTLGTIHGADLKTPGTEGQVQVHSDLGRSWLFATAAPGGKIRVRDATHRGNLDQTMTREQATDLLLASLRPTLLAALATLEA